jgi:hypothetical protein
LNDIIIYCDSDDLRHLPLSMGEAVVRTSAVDCASRLMSAAHWDDDDCLDSSAWLSATDSTNSWKSVGVSIRKLPRHVNRS